TGQKKPRCDEGAQTQMMPLETPVVGENFGRSEKERCTAKRPMLAIAIEQHDRESDAKAAKSRARKIVARNQEMPARGFEPLDLGEHAFHQRRVARCERYNDSFRILTQYPEYKILEGAQRISIVTTSPVVLSLPLGLAIYPTCTRRPRGCTPHEKLF